MNTDPTHPENSARWCLTMAIEQLQFALESIDDSDHATQAIENGVRFANSAAKFLAEAGNGTEASPDA
jgi:hypothetical protein